MFIGLFLVVSLKCDDISIVLDREMKGKRILTHLNARFLLNSVVVYDKLDTNATLEPIWGKSCLFGKSVNYGRKIIAKVQAVYGMIFLQTNFSCVTSG